MRSVKTFVAAAIGLWAVAFVTAQTQKVTTVEEYDKTMKAVNAANGAMRKAIQSNATDEAKTQLAALRQNIANAETFWVDKKKSDALGFIKTVRAGLDAVEKALAGSDPAAVQAALKEMTGGCQGCHMEYREMDPAGGFRIIAAKIGGLD
jgi:cytochrome c556